MMARAGMRSADRGFTLIELIVVVVVVSLLATAALERLLAYQEMAEKAAMETTLVIVRTGLQIRLAELIIDNRQREAAQLETANPMQWLTEQPANYAGEYRAPPERGTWYYDTPQRELVYVANSATRLDAEPVDGEKQIRFRIRLVRDRIEVAGARLESVTGVTLVPARPYRWSPPRPGGLFA